MEKQEEVLSKITTGWSEKVEESFYINRLIGIDAAYSYLSKKLSDKKESRSADLALRFVWGFLLGMLFSLIVLFGEVLKKIAIEVLH